MWNAPLLGIDFSGDATQWSPRRKTSAIWIAAASPEGDGIHVGALAPVQHLDGVEPPFARLSRLLATTTGHVGIDAPFAIPAGFSPPPPELWRAIARAGEAEPKRPFARGHALLRLAFGDAIPTSGPQHAPYGKKSYRATEAAWRGVAPRSTLWNGPRGGAAFAVAAMTLLARHPGAVWPFRNGGAGRTLIEAYPAAQMKQWGLDPTLYAGETDAARAKRQVILRRLQEERALTLGHDLDALCLDHVDALDAVLCCFCAQAVATGRLAVAPDDRVAGLEGHIAVHA